MTPPVALASTLVLLAAQSSACATRRTGGPRAECRTATVDPAWLEAGPIYAACDVDRPARMVGEAPPFEYMPERGKSCYAVLLEFVVSAAGAPEPTTARIVRTTWSDFARGALAILPYLRYEPAVRGGRPVRQLAQWGIVVTIPVFEVITTRAGQVPVAQRPNCTP